MRRHRLTGEERPLHIDGELPVVTVLRDFEKGPHIENGGTVDENVDTAAGSHDPLDHGVDGCPVGDIQSDGHAADFGRKRSPFVGENVGHHDKGTFLGIAATDGAADPARTAGDDGGFSFETHPSSPVSVYQQV